MPTIGSSNPWHEEAISTAATVVLGSGAEIRATKPALLVATKLCAWKGRGGGDTLASLDVHDVLTLIDGRPVVEEIGSAAPDLREYIRAETNTLRAGPYLDYAIDGATAGYGPVGAGRAGLVRDRIDELLG